MKKIIITILMLTLLLSLSGCLDIKDSAKAMGWGNSENEQAMISALNKKYGNLTGDGEPRIIELMVTTETEDFIPKDKVSKYSSSTPEFKAWFVYDNFDNEEVEIEFIFTDESHSIYTFTSETGDDFGRSDFTLESPDGGFPVGNYKVVVTGAGVTATKTFEVYDGATISTPIILPDGTVNIDGENYNIDDLEDKIETTEKTETEENAETAEKGGYWELVNTEFMDSEDSRADHESEGVISYYQKVDDVDGRGGYTHDHTFTYDIPKNSYGENEEIVLNLVLSQNNSTGNSNSSVHIYATVNGQSLKDSNGDLCVGFSSTTLSELSVKGTAPDKSNDKMQIEIKANNTGGDFKAIYTYEWRE